MKLLKFNISNKDNIPSQLLKKSSEASLEEAGQIINDLQKELYLINKTSNTGIGLAAPQIGINKQVAIIRFNNIKLNLVNPKILSQKDKVIVNEEGCLSFPNIVKRTARYNEVIIENMVAPYKFMATGYLAICCQHEIDHLDGITFLDRSI